MKIFRVGISRISITELETSSVIASISCSGIVWFHAQGLVCFTLRDVARTTKIYISLLRGTGENRFVDLGLYCFALPDPVYASQENTTTLPSSL